MTVINSETEIHRQTPTAILNESFDPAAKLIAVEPMTYNPISGALERQTAIQGNPSLVLGRNANGKVITLTKTIGSTSYVKTLTRDANDVLTAVSAWV